jgi:hypothetical protein
MNNTLKKLLQDRIAVIEQEMASCEHALIFHEEEVTHWKNEIESLYAEKKELEAELR